MMEAVSEEFRCRYEEQESIRDFCKSLTDCKRKRIAGNTGKGSSCEKNVGRIFNKEKGEKT